MRSISRRHALIAAVLEMTLEIYVVWLSSLSIVGELTGEATEVPCFADFPDLATDR